MWCIQEINDEYKERMYDILDLYEEDHDPKRPIICLDEKSKQLLGDIKQPIKSKPGSLEKFDYNYKRNGTCNLFVGVNPKEGNRIIQITQRRTKQDFANYLKEVVDSNTEAELIRIVCDNLNTHKLKSLYETFDKAEADRISKKIEFHYTPKHASWLNMAEIEINVLDKECLNRRMQNIEYLKSEVNCWTKRRNELKKKINWTFKKEDANKKLSKYYVSKLNC